MKLLYATLAAMLLSVPAFAQTEVELSGLFGRPSLTTDKIGFKANASMLTKVDRLRLGFSYADGEGSNAFYGPLVSLSLGQWNISKGVTPKTVEVELMGFTDISGGFDFNNGAVGAGAILDLMPGNRIKEIVRVLWSDGENMEQAWLVALGLRFDLE